MKRFYDFINEDNQDSIKQPFDEFLNEIENNLITDFKLTEKQVDIYVKQYYNILKDGYEQGLTTREAIASTKKIW